MNLLQQLQELDNTMSAAPWKHGLMQDLFPEIKHKPEWDGKWGCTFDEKLMAEGSEADAKGKAFLRNSLPQILAMLTAAEGMSEALGLLGPWKPKSKLGAALTAYRTAKANATKS